MFTKSIAMSVAVSEMWVVLDRAWSKSSGHYWDILNKC